MKYLGFLILTSVLLAALPPAVAPSYAQPATTVILRGVACPSATLCVAVGNAGTIVTGTDGGVTWTARTSGTTQPLSGVACPTPTLCVAVGSGGTIVTSADGGVTWTPRPNPATANQPLLGVDCLSAILCVAVGFSIILTSADNGVTWVARTSGVTTFLHGVSCPTATLCVIAGNGGTLLSSTDGGTTWAPTAQNTGTVEILNAVSCAVAGLCVAVGDTGTVVTIQAASVVPRTSPTPLAFHGVTCPTTTLCVAVGRGGVLGTSADGGVTWTLRTSGTTQDLGAVDCPNAALCLAVGDAGTILRSTDAGVTWTVAAGGPPSTALLPALWVPIAVKAAAGDNSGIQVQNNAEVPASVAVDYINQAGNVVFSTPPQTVGAGRSVTYYQPAESGLPDGFDGSAVIRSNQAIAAIVNRTNYTGSLASAGSFTVPGVATANQVTVPLTYGGKDGYFTTLSVQNTGTTVATYTVSLTPNIGTPGSPASTAVTIPPNAVRRIRVGTDIAVPAGFIGSATISSTTGTLVAAGETRNSGNSIWFGSGGVATGATSMNAPLLFKNYGDKMWLSGLQVANTTTSTITVNGAISSRDSNTSFTLPTTTLGPNQAEFYDLLTSGGLPDNFVGAATFTASGPIALTIQQVSALEGTGMGYNGFSGGTTTVSVPLVFKNSNAWDSGVQVQNLGAAPTTILITYFSNAGGLLASETQVAQPGKSVTFYQPAVAGLPDGLVGSATVTSDGQPIVAIINEVNYLRGGDASMTYEGINIP